MNARWRDTLLWISAAVALGAGLLRLRSSAPEPAVSRAAAPGPVAAALARSPLWLAPGESADRYPAGLFSAPELSFDEGEACWKTPSAPGPALDPAALHLVSVGTETFPLSLRAYSGDPGMEIWVLEQPESARWYRARVGDAFGEGCFTAEARITRASSDGRTAVPGIRVVDTRCGWTADLFPDIPSPVRATAEFELAGGGRLRLSEGEEQEVAGLIFRCLSITGEDGYTVVAYGPDRQTLNRAQFSNPFRDEDPLPVP